MGGGAAGVCWIGGILAGKQRCFPAAFRLGLLLGDALTRSPVTDRLLGGVVPQCKGVDFRCLCVPRGQAEGW